MPIFDQSYRAYTGTRTGRAARIASIAWMGVRPPLKKRAFLLLLLVGLAPFVYRFVLLFLADYANAFNLPTQLGPGRSILPTSTDAEYFHSFLFGQRYVLFVLTVWAGAGLVSDDIASGALPLYLSRPVGKLDYVVGKLMTLLVLGAVVTAAPVLLLWLLLATKAVGTGQAPPLAIGLRSLLAAFGMMLVYDLLMLAISSLSGSWRVAGIAFTALFLVSSVVSQVLRAVPVPGASLVSLGQVLETSGRIVFGLAPRAEDPDWVPLASVLVLAGYLGLSALVLWARISSRSRP